MRARTKDGKFVKTDDDSEQVADMSKLIAFGKWVALLLILMPWLIMLYTTFHKSFYKFFTDGIILFAENLHGELNRCVKTVGKTILQNHTSTQTSSTDTLNINDANLW